MTPTYQYRWWALLGVSLLAFTSFLDYTIVNTALPTIQYAFKANVLQLQWVSNGYSLILSMLMIAAGKVGDLYGRRRIFYWAMLIFLVASIGAGASQSMLMLIIFRMLQGVGAAAVFTLSVALLSEIFPPEKQTVAISFYTAITGAGLAVGPFLGGLLVTILSWRWVFFINVPIVALGLLFCSFSVRKSPVNPAIRIDYIGLIFLIITIGSLVIGLIQGGQQGWYSFWPWCLLAIALIAFIILLWSQHVIKNPLLDSTVFKSRALLMGAIGCMMGGVISYVLMFFNPLYLSIVRGQSALMLGIILMAIPVAQVIVSALFHYILKVWSIFSVIVIAQLIGAIAGFMHLFFGVTTSFVIIIIAYMLLGVNWAIANAGSVTVVDKYAEPKHIGTTIGTIFTMWNIFGAVSLAISAVIFQAREKTLMARELVKHQLSLTPAQHHMVSAMLSDPEGAKSLLQQIGGKHMADIFIAFRQAFLSGFHAVALLVTVLLLLSFIVCLIIWPRHQARRDKS